MSAEQGTPNKSDKSTSRHCSVPRCNSRQANGISYHKLPTENRQRDEWIQLLKLGKNIKNAFVCSLHFKKEDYISPGKHKSIICYKINENFFSNVYINLFFKICQLKGQH